MQNRPLPDTVNTLKNLMQGALFFPEYTLTFAWATWELLAWDRATYLNLESYAWRESLRWQVIQCYTNLLQARHLQCRDSILVRNFSIFYVVVGSFLRYNIVFISNI